MNVDQIIDKLLAVRGNKPGKQVDLGEDEIKFLIDKSLQIIKVQKMLVELEAGVKFLSLIVEYQV